ncbi:MAG: hypothetical protein WCO56_18865 [Verrucomicrobiota bacterium]
MYSSQKHHNSQAAPASNPGAAFYPPRSRRTSVGAELFAGLFPFRVFGVIRGSSPRFPIFNSVIFVFSAVSLQLSALFHPVHPVNPVSSFAMFSFRVVCVFGGSNSLGYRRSAIGDFVCSPICVLQFSICNTWPFAGLIAPITPIRPISPILKSEI